MTTFIDISNLDYEDQKYNYLKKYFVFATSEIKYKFLVKKTKMLLHHGSSDGKDRKVPGSIPAWI